MPKLANKGRYLRSAPTGDSGAVTTLFAILLGTGLLISILGLVVDGGQLMIEKQLVRKAAGAVAEAVGTHCARAVSGSNCLADDYSTVNAFSGLSTATQANSDLLATIANPKGGDVAITLICGRTQLSIGIPSCPSLTGSPNDCSTDLANADSFQNWIRVYTSTGPSGFQPVFENFLAASPQQYQETSCSQVYWGTADAINVSKSGNILPIMIGQCEVQTAGFDKTLELTGDVTSSPCTATDRAGMAVTASSRGFMEFDPTSSADSCWVLGVSYCSNVPLNTTKSRTGLSYPQIGYAGLLSLLNTFRTDITYKRTVVLPVVNQTGSTYSVKGYVGFTLLGYNFPTTSSISQTQTKKQYKTFCPGTPTNTSAYCIAGQFTTRVYGTYGQVSGLGITTSSNVPNLGYQVIKHIR